MRKVKKEIKIFKLDAYRGPLVCTAGKHDINNKRQAQLIDSIDDDNQPCPDMQSITGVRRELNFDE